MRNKEDAGEYLRVSKMVVFLQHVEMTFFSSLLQDLSADGRCDVREARSSRMKSAELWSILRTGDRQAIEKWHERLTADFNWKWQLKGTHK